MWRNGCRASGFGPHIPLAELRRERREIQDALQLGTENRFEARPVLLRQHAIVEHAGGMDHAAQRRHVARDVVQQCRQGGQVGNIDRSPAHSHTLCRKPRDGVPGLQ